jgi:hypothetical protein
MTLPLLLFVFSYFLIPPVSSEAVSSVKLSVVLKEVVRVCPQNCHLMCGGPDALTLVLSRFDPTLVDLLMDACNADLNGCAHKLARLVCTPNMHSCFSLGFSAELLNACISSATGVMGTHIGAYVEEHNDPVNAFVIILTATIIWMSLCHMPQRR